MGSHNNCESVLVSVGDFRYNILFLLSGGGKFNYLGSKKWIDDQQESESISHVQYQIGWHVHCMLLVENGLLVDAEYVLCLDSIGHMSDLHIHVSKPPKEGSSAHLLMKVLELF